MMWYHSGTAAARIHCRLSEDVFAVRTHRGIRACHYLTSGSTRAANESQRWTTVVTRSLLCEGQYVRLFAVGDGPRTKLVCIVHIDCRRCESECGPVRAGTGSIINDNVTLSSILHISHNYMILPEQSVHTWLSPTATPQPPALRRARTYQSAPHKSPYDNVTCFDFRGCGGPVFRFSFYCEY